MTTHDAALAGLNLPAAAREQGEVLAIDLELTERARLSHPAARWWWGERQRPEGNGAYCYLCNRLVVTWQRSRPTTLQAVELILGHRRDHADLGPGPIGTDAGGTIPPAVAPTAGGQ